MEVLENWLLLLTDSSEQNQTRMQLDELPRLSMFKVLSFLRFTELPAVLLTSKALAGSVVEYLREQPTVITKDDTVRMSPRRVLAALNSAPSHQRLQICCFEAKIGKLLGAFGRGLQVLKLVWLDERHLYKQTFWQALLQHRDSLRSLTLGITRTSSERLPVEERITDATMKLFFSEMYSLVKFSCKFSNNISEESRFDYAGYATTSLPYHTMILAGLLGSTTRLKKLTLQNIVLLETTTAQWPTADSVEELKIQYEGDLPELVLPNNSLRLRLTNHSFLFALQCFPLVNQLTVKDWSGIDNKYLCSECINRLTAHCQRINRPLQLQINSYTWHWQLSKLDLFQLCELPLGGELLSLRSLYSLDADAINLVANANKWNPNGIDFSYSNINDQCLEVITEVFSGVRTLGLSGCKKLSKERLVECIARFRNLQSFHAEEAHGFTNSCMSALIEAHHNTLKSIKLKKNKVSGDNIADCLHRCSHLSVLVLRNMNNIYDDFHFRWIAGLHADKFHSNTLLELDISNNERFERKFLKRLRKLFPCLQTLKIIYTVDIQEREPMVHPNLLHLTALIDVTKVRKYKQTCLQAFPSLIILHTELKKQTRSAMHQLRPKQEERRLMIYDHDGEMFVV